MPFIENIKWQQDLVSQEQNLIDIAVALSNGKTLSQIANIIEQTLLKTH